MRKALKKQCAILLFLAVSIAAQCAAVELGDPSLFPECDYGEATPDRIRQYAKTVSKIGSGAEALLDEALNTSTSSFSSTGIIYLDLFKFLMKADEVVCPLYNGDYSEAIKSAVGSSAELALAKTLAGRVLSGPIAIAQLAALPTQYSLNAFYDQAVTLAINNQTILYAAARSMGYSHQFIMEGASDDTILFTDDGWLYIVGEKRISGYGAVRPGNYPRDQLYGALGEVYRTSSASASYLRDKQKVAEEFGKLLNPNIKYAPDNPAAPVVMTFTPSGMALNGPNIQSYLWDFGDGNTSTDRDALHTYRKPGGYTVSLTVTRSDGSSSAFDQSIHVRPPTINTTFKEGYESLKREFSTPASNYIKRYQWSFGDYSYNDERTTEHTYAESRAYTVGLTVELDDASQISNEETIYVGSASGIRIIPGHTITGTETWYRGNTYLVKGRIVIMPGATLRIEPGTTIKLEGGTGWSGPGFWVQGSLLATGAKFTWAEEGSEWGGISFYGSGSSKSQLKNCVFEHASGTSIHSAQAYNTGVIVIQDASPIIDNCVIRLSSAETGIFSYSTGGAKRSAPTIRNSSITGFSKSGGIMIDNDWFFNINTYPRLYPSFTTINGNYLSGNAIGLYIPSGGVVSGNEFIKNKTGMNVIYNEKNLLLASRNTYSNNSAANFEASGTLVRDTNWDDMKTVHVSGLITVPKGEVGLIDLYGLKAVSVDKQTNHSIVA